ncbi:MAG: YXWGXW repeat-containing protein [Rudaea sp.]|uniref:YXWGXW repeat-containing protein n=1 Tax=unclassified Rudaea TaxID=2627037 RepID=UPI0010F5E6C8|nr:MULTISPECIES: YXWGXW repeat-containing protein [unclassified Rudaea]MBN8885527.1 YXWGXW repeat-containing protein [Rudaea sp.]
MRLPAILLVSTLAAGAALAPSTGEARVYVDIGVAPPPPRVVAVPPPRAGYVWAPGYWYWNGSRHVWHSGYWMSERRGYHWVAPAWEPRGPRWHYVPGRWER